MLFMDAPFFSSMYVANLLPRDCVFPEDLVVVYYSSSPNRVIFKKANFNILSKFLRFTNSYINETLFAMVFCFPGGFSRYGPQIYLQMYLMDLLFLGSFGRRGLHPLLMKEKVPGDCQSSGLEPNVFSFIGKWLTYLGFKIYSPKKLRI